MREIRMMFFIACRPFNTIKNENFEYRIFHRARARCKSLLVKLLSRVTIQRRMIKSDRRCYYRLIITSSVRL